MRQYLSLLLVAAATGMLKAETRDSSGVEMDHIVVTGTRYKTDVRHLPYTLSSLNQEKLTENHRSNVLPTLGQEVPGLFVSSRGILGYGVSTGAAGGIKVRGIGSMANLLVLVDGLPQYAGLYGHPIADACQTLMAERVEVLRGPASAVYGSNAMGGVVNIVTREMRHEGVHTHLSLQGGSYGTLEANAVNRLRKGRFSSVVGANCGRTDGHRPNASFAQGSGFVKLGYEMGNHWGLTADANLTRFNSSNPGEVDNPYIDNDMQITRGLASLSLTNTHDRTSGALRAYYNWGHHHINDGYRPGATPRTALYLHNDRMGGLSIYQNARLFTGNRTTAGIDLKHHGGHAWNRAFSDGSRTDLVRKSVNEVAAYVDVQQSLLPWLMADAALRIDHHSRSGTEWIPQGGLSLLLPRQATVRARVSKGFRNATLRELYMFRPANADLQPERMWNYELAYRQALLDGRLRLGTNLFYLKADNLIENRMVDGKPLNLNTGQTEHWGLEAEAAWRIDRHWALDGNYSFLHMSRVQLAAPEHKLYLGGRWERGRLRLNTGLQYVAGLHTATGSTPREEDFMLWNLTANYRLLPGLTLFAKGENLLAQRYETLAGYPMPRAIFMGGVQWVF